MDSTIQGEKYPNRAEKKRAIGKLDANLRRFYAEAR